MISTVMMISQSVCAMAPDVTYVHFFFPLSTFLYVALIYNMLDFHYRAFFSAVKQSLPDPDISLYSSRTRLVSLSQCDT